MALASGYKVEPDRRVDVVAGVWITELPITPERVLRALEEKREPRREGKKVVFDEELSEHGIERRDPLRGPRLTLIPS